MTDYNFQLKLLPPEEIDNSFFMKELIAAHAAIAELRGFLGTLKNPDLLIAPFRKREAVASSAIEGTRATLDEVIDYEASDEVRQLNPQEKPTEKVEDIKEVMNYESAMGVAMRELKARSIGEVLLKKTHARLLRSGRGSSKTPGEFRKFPVAVGDYRPPIAASIPELMSNWEKFLNDDDTFDVLVRIAIAHYQFEAIHPFMDGNGRIGRLIIPLFLCEQEVLKTPVLYVSHYFDQYKVEYQRLLHEIDTDRRWNEWIKFFLVATEAQAKLALAKAKDMQELYEKHKVETLPRLKSQHALEVLDLLFMRPLVSTTTISEVIKAKSRATSYNLVKKLVKEGVLQHYFTIGREKYYDFGELRKLIRR